MTEMELALVGMVEHPDATQHALSVLQETSPGSSWPSWRRGRGRCRHAPPLPTLSGPEIKRSGTGTTPTPMGWRGRLERCHAVAALVRDILGYGSDNLPDGAPRFALTYRN
jgi:hypothetical protein